MTGLSWARDDKVLVVNARTCGLNKDGVEQYEVDPATGARKTTIDDELARVVGEIATQGSGGAHARYVDEQRVLDARIIVPCYYDLSSLEAFEAFVEAHASSFESRSIGELVDAGDLVVRKGHGSPSSDQRIGDVPYIKVSDLRAGSININPSNRVPRALAEKFWRSNSSGLRAYDLISPERASKNIGEFCVLMPGQEDIVLTKEVLIFRGVNKKLSQFYLMWAMSLSIVREQWTRVIFMQTNREDVGGRFLDIRLPFPKTLDVSQDKGAPFRDYFESLNTAKSELRSSLRESGEDFHLFFA
jgi:hypothetical protein